MRSLVVIEFLTVDGVMQGLGSPDEDTDGGFRHGGWRAPYAEAIHEVVASGDPTRTTSFLFGRRTYEKMAAYWPFQPDDNPMARQLNHTPKHVATRNRTQFDWPGTTPLAGALVDTIPRLKASGEGDIAVLGSGVLVDSLLKLDLVDELRLFVHPLLLGTGKRLFRGLPAPRQLQLTSWEATTRGTLGLGYRFLRDRV